MAITIDSNTLVTFILFKMHTYLYVVCNLLASLLMHKYNAHGATDVGGYGLLGHANNLANIQKNEVGFVIHNLPVIAKMAAVSKACGNMFGLLQGHAAETSGNFCHVNLFFMAASCCTW